MNSNARSVASDQGLHCLPKSQKMPLDRSSGQNHLKGMSSLFYLL